MSFWDISSPFYDVVERSNTNYERWINRIVDYVDKDSRVLEVAAGTGEISLRVSAKAKKVVCSDISSNMIRAAKRKTKDISNISFKRADINRLDFKDNSFDVVIASQILHLLDNPKQAIDELVRVSNNKIILPMSLTRDIKGFTKLQLGIWKKLGYDPKREFDEESYLNFLLSNDLNVIESTVIDGNIPMMIVVCEKRRESSVIRMLKNKTTKVLDKLLSKKNLNPITNLFNRAGKK